MFESTNLMTDEKIHLPANKTTYLATLYGKALDARNPQPILGDTYADAAVRRIDFDFASLKLPDGGDITLPVRAKHLDGWTRDFIAAHPTSTILHLGCGLDSRVFRIDPPATVAWYDVDFPDVIDLRRQLYPARDHYTMIGVPIDGLAWLDAIPTGAPVLVIGEGFFMYLAEAEVLALFRRIISTFPGGEFIFDAYSAPMVWLVSRLSTVRGAAVTLKWGVGDPHKVERQVEGLKLVEEQPFFCLPDLVRLGARTRIMCGTPGLRNLVKHVRYRF